MRSHRRQWVEAAIEETEAENAVQLRNMIVSGELSISSRMVTKGNAIDFCEQYMTDEERRCIDCEIECMAGDEYHICPECNSMYP